MERLSTNALIDEHSAPDLEARRIAAVQSLGLFEGPHDPAYQEAVFLAAMICATPISLVTVLDGTTQHFKAKVGIDLCTSPQHESFCVHAIQQRKLFVVSDTLLDTRFLDLPFVTKAPNIRFYAGVPLTTTHGEAVGTLCVIDVVPRELSEQQRAALEMLSRQVAARLEDRNKMERLESTILEKERIEQDLRSSNALFEAFMDNSPLVGFMKDEAGRLIYYNRSFAEHFRISRTAWIGKDEYEFFPPDVAASLRLPDDKVMKSGELSVMEVAIPGGDGKVHEWRTYKFAFVKASGDRFLAGMSHEITIEKHAIRELERYHHELRLANERLIKLSLTDPLTGCGNRRSFDERLNHEFMLAARHGFELSVLILDIDNFKSINDRFGHETGDRVLCHVTGLLREGARETDLVSRYGGEEFAILLPHTGKDDAYLLADRMRASIEERWDGCPVTVSVGVGTASCGAIDASMLLRQADEALYEAKATGKNRVVLAGCA